MGHMRVYPISGLQPSHVRRKASNEKSARAATKWREQEEAAEKVEATMLEAQAAAARDLLAASLEDPECRRGPFVASTRPPGPAPATAQAGVLPSPSFGHLLQCVVHHRVRGRHRIVFVTARAGSRRHRTAC